MSGRTTLNRLDPFILANPLSDGALTPSTFALPHACSTRATLVTAPRSLVPLQIRNRDNFAVIPQHPGNDSGRMGSERFRAKACRALDPGGYLFGRRKRVNTTDWSLRSDTLGREKLLARGLDHIAIGSAGHHAILHLARGGQIVGQPNADGQQDDRDDKARDRAT